MEDHLVQEYFKRLHEKFQEDMPSKFIGIESLQS